MKFLLVGQGFHPGASPLLSYGLKQGAKVALRAEPENRFDPLAVRVEVGTTEVQRSSALEVAFLGATGRELNETWFPLTLGHLGARLDTKAAQAATSQGFEFALVHEWHEGGRPEEGTLCFTASGVVLIEVEEPEAEATS